jgi:hypothetical protein
LAAFYRLHFGPPRAREGGIRHFRQFLPPLAQKPDAYQKNCGLLVSPVGTRVEIGAATLAGVLILTGSGEPIRAATIGIRAPIGTGSGGAGGWDSPRRKRIGARKNLFDNAPIGTTIAALSCAASLAIAAAARRSI